MESVKFLDVHLRVLADVIDEPHPRGVVIVVQLTPRLHPLYPVHRSCIRSNTYTVLLSTPNAKYIKSRLLVCVKLPVSAHVIVDFIKYIGFYNRLWFHTPLIFFLVFYLYWLCSTIMSLIALLCWYAIKNLLTHSSSCRRYVMRDGRVGLICPALQPEAVQWGKRGSRPHPQ